MPFLQSTAKHPQRTKRLAAGTDASTNVERAVANEHPKQHMLCRKSQPTERSKLPHQRKPYRNLIEIQNVSRAFIVLANHIGTARRQNLFCRPARSILMHARASSYLSLLFVLHPAFVTPTYRGSRNNPCHNLLHPSIHPSIHPMCYPCHQSHHAFPGIDPVKLYINTHLTWCVLVSN